MQWTNPVKDCVFPLIMASGLFIGIPSDAIIVWLRKLFLKTLVLLFDNKWCSRPFLVIPVVCFKPNDDYVDVHRDHCMTAYYTSQYFGIVDNKWCSRSFLVVPAVCLIPEDDYGDDKGTNTTCITFSVVIVLWGW